ncbi:hypothetical protein COLO4_06137 [Corchorus olitorius]|uniref:Protein kinase domain-containing protein n=1 Tax=Corchorus olitorius TaxID=93759 RepID=A0A1R3KP27_9ROSI|nr:hypothetical protein COLO4_06137 [Corchorus olitorius]
MDPKLHKPKSVQKSPWKSKEEALTELAGFDSINFLSGLNYLHRRYIVHRDIKPSNRSLGLN